MCTCRTSSHEYLSVQFVGLSRSEIILISLKYDMNTFYLSITLVIGQATSVFENGTMLIE